MNNNTYNRYSGKKYNSNNNSNSERNGSRNASNDSTHNNYHKKNSNNYSVFVKNTRDLTEEQIRNSLENEFGTIVKITTGENYTVIDFDNENSQSNCLSKAKMNIDEEEVVFEKRQNQRRQSSNNAQDYQRNENFLST